MKILRASFIDGPRNVAPIPSMLAAGLIVAAVGFLPLQQLAEGQGIAARQRTFASPGDAAAGLRQAAQAGDKAAIADIFGSDSRDLLTGDPVQDATNFKEFSRAVAEKLTPVPSGDDKVVLEVGAKGWPFPIPLIKKGGTWSFDTAAGKDEIINRHIGKDELHAVGVCREYVKGLGRHTNILGPKSIHGYFFKVLTRQGPLAPGGEKDYMVNGSMTGGFALVAYPEQWDRSGVMTFIVNQDGNVYRRDLGENTTKIAGAMTQYNPDDLWKIEKEPGIDFKGDGHGKE